MGTIKTEVTIILIFILLFIGPIMPSKGLYFRQSYKQMGNIIIVNASGSGDYTHIQWAIDSASNGDTIFIECGEYNEKITISKKITLIGENRDRTIISGNFKDHVVEIVADEVCLSELKIINDPIGIWLNGADRCIIENTILLNNWNGLQLSSDSNNNHILGNTINQNSNIGVYIADSSMNIVIDNDICNNNLCGITFNGGFRNEIKESNIKSNNEGIRCSNSYNNIIDGNMIEFNNNGIYLYESNEIFITNNTIDFNTEAGIYLYESNEISITNNTINFNTEAGIYFYNSDNNIIIGNLVTFNDFVRRYGGYGLYLCGDDNRVEENRIQNNFLEGVRINGNRCLVKNNIINNHNETGIRLYRSNTSLISNNILHNKYSDIYIAGRCYNNNINNNTMRGGGICVDSYPIGSLLTLCIDPSNMLNDKPVYLLINQIGGTTPNNAGQIILINCTQVIIDNQHFHDCYSGIQSIVSSRCLISNCTFINNTFAGISFIGWGKPTSCIENRVDNCTFLLNNDGVNLYYANQNHLYQNAFHDNNNGIFIDRGYENLISSNQFIQNINNGVLISHGRGKNTIHNNCFINNNNGSVQAWDDGDSNCWWSGTTGNYWSDFTEPDNDHNGIVDRPYYIGGEAHSFDKYPLINPHGIPLPVANVGSNITIEQHDKITFNSSASLGIPFINNYTWSFTYNNTDLNLFGPNPSFTFHLAGTYIIDLTVRNNLYESTNDTCWVTVLDITPPTLSLESEMVIDQHETLYFNESLFHDNVGIVNCTWVLTRNEYNKKMYGPDLSIRFDIPGQYILFVVLTDMAGNTAEHIILVTVIDITPPTAYAGEDVTSDKAELVTFDASGSSDNVGISNYTWTFDYPGEKIRLEGKKTKFHFQRSGTFIVTLTVGDKAGNEEIDMICITIFDDVAPLAAAGENRTVYAGTILSFNGSNSRDNVCIINFTWEFIYNDTIYLVYGPEWNHTFTYPANYTIRLTVIDDVGLHDQDAIWIKVPDMKRPRVDAGKDVFINVNEAVLFNGSGSWDNAGIVNYSWAFTVEGTNIKLYGVISSYIFQFPGVFDVKLEVTDGDGNSETDWMTVTVNGTGEDEEPDDGPDVNRQGEAVLLICIAVMSTLFIVMLSLTIAYVIVLKRKGEGMLDMNILKTSGKEGNGWLMGGREKL